MGSFNAEPTKDFFIDMLTRDIPLEWAILDLLDNSVDGARNKITSQSGDFKSPSAYRGFKIELTFNEHEFIIVDNCGGFTKKAAESYAFKIGRPRLAEGLPKGSVGRFGVGMKRGIFKLGAYFVVETKSGSDHFIVEEDIDEWNTPGRKWEFEFTDVTERQKYKSHRPVLREDGTYIRVCDLKEAVVQDLTSSSFKKMLVDEIQRILSYSIERGLEVKVNGVKLEAKPIELLVSPELLPYFLEEDINGVNIRIYAGIGVPNPNEAGWYIFCNDRLMVEREKTNLTGWEGNEKFFGDSGVQKFHNKVAMFRGLVFFSADDASLLPMTTTKTGIDINSTIYKSTRSKMINAMKIVLSYLNKLENDEQRQIIVKDSKSINIIKYHEHQKLDSTFVFPDVKKDELLENTLKISYRVNKDLAMEVKKMLKVSTAEKIGLETFNYYVQMKEIDL